MLVLVEPPPEMVDGEWSAEKRLPVEAPVTVTDAHMIFEGEQAFVRVVIMRLQRANPTSGRGTASALC